VRLRRVIDFQPAGPAAGRRPWRPGPGVLVLPGADREVDELSLRLAMRGVHMLAAGQRPLAALELTWDVLDGVVETADVRFAPRRCSCGILRRLGPLARRERVDDTCASSGGLVQDGAGRRASVV